MPLNSEILVTLGDTLEPASFVVKLNDHYPNLDDFDLVQFHVWDDSMCPVDPGPADDVVAASGSEAFITLQPSKSVTADTTAKNLYSVNHDLTVGLEVVFSTDGTLPAPLVAGNRYFVVSVNGHNFGVSRQRSSKAIKITTAGTGTHEYIVVGHGLYAWQSGDVDTASAKYKAEVLLSTGGAVASYRGSDGKGIPVKIVGTACDV